MPQRKFKCEECDHTWEQASAKAECPECGCKYCQWLNYQPATELQLVSIKDQKK